MPRLLWIILFVFTAFLTSSTAMSATIPKEIRVGVTFGPPFVFKEDVHYTGVAVELWRRVAERNQWNYTFVPMSANIEDSITALVDGKIDILIGDISTTYTRSQKVYFSRPYFINKIGLVVKKRAMTLIETLEFYTTLKVTQLIYILLMIYIFSAHLYWLVERGHNPAVPKDYFAGITTSLWDFVYHLLGGGDLSEPVTKIGHFITITWLIILFFSLVTITASVTSELTIAKAEDYSDFSSLEALKNKPIAAVMGRFSVQLAKKISKRVIEVADLQQAFAMLDTEKVSAVVEDYTIAQQNLKSFNYKDLFMSKLIIQYDEYAFALPKNSPIYDALNQGITYLQDYGFMLPLCRSFLSDSEAQFCSL